MLSSKSAHPDPRPSGAGRPGRHRLALSAGVATLALINCAATLAIADDSKSFFERRVASILSERCAARHNPGKRGGGLDVTSRDSLLKGGESGPAVLPGKKDESLLLDMVGGDEPEMPKKSKPLTAEQRTDLRRWIEAGAEWPAGVKVTAGLWSLRNRPGITSRFHMGSGMAR